MLSRPVRLSLLALAAVLAFGAVFCFAFTPLTMSQDEWWHLKAGKWIWQHDLRPPVNDIFSYTSSDLCWKNPKPYRWDNHEWFAEVVMYLASAAGERTGFGQMRAVIALKTAVWLAAFGLVAFFAWKRSRKFTLALLVTVCAAYASRYTAQPRPPIVTYFFIAFFHIALAAYRAGRIRAAHLLALPVLMAGWANLHGGFILGGLLIAAFFAGEAIEFLWFRSGRGGADSIARRDGAWRRGRVLFAVGILCGLASLATPFGWRLYLLTYRVMSDKALSSLIAELQPPPLQFFGSYVTLIALTALGMALNFRRVFIGEALWLALLLHQSLSHVRHVPLFAIASAPVAAEMIAAAWERWKPRRAWAEGAMETALVLLTAGLSLVWTTHRWLPPLFDRTRAESYLDHTVDLFRGRAYSINFYPVRLADFIEDADFHGRMFNDSRYAGYLIWRFSPEKRQVFTDMRYDIFGGDFVLDDLAGRAGAVALDERNVLDWRTVYAKWDVNFTIFDRKTANESLGRRLLPEIDASKDWTLVYRDPGDRGLLIYLRNTPQNADLLARCRRLAPDGLYERPGRQPWGG